VALALASRFSRMLSFQIKNMEFTGLDRVGSDFTFITTAAFFRADLIYFSGEASGHAGHAVHD
jgi:hypothetical protein